MAKKTAITVANPTTVILGKNGSTMSPHDQAKQIAVTDRKALVVADYSSSMGGHTSQGLRRIDEARTALATAATSLDITKVFAFSDDVKEMAGATLPEPSGCTQMGKALDHVFNWGKAFRRVILISDGEPTDGNEWNVQAHRYAEARVRIFTIFTGDGTGEHVMKEIARITGGTYEKEFNTGPLQLAEAIIRAALPSGK